MGTQLIMLVACTLLLLAGPSFQDPGPQGGAPPEQEAAQPGYKVEHFSLPRGRSARLYMELRLVNPDPMTPMLVLYHRARSSKGEYRPVVLRLRDLGYNCLAVDLCSGNECREIINLTAKNARGFGRNPTFLDALTDIEDSLAWAREKVAHGQLIVWGSGFSAALALHEAALRPERVDGVIAFSPAESFASLGKSATWIQESARTVQCPVFVTSARSEQAEWQPIFAAIAAKVKVSFLPVGAGESGSPALWTQSKDSAEYWAALTGFLQVNFPTVPAATAPKGR